MQIQYALILVEGPVRKGQLSEVNTSTLGLVSEVKLDPVENFTIKGGFLLSVQTREIRYRITLSNEN